MKVYSGSQRITLSGECPEKEIMRQPPSVVPRMYETPPTDMMLPSALERVLVPLTIADPAPKTQTFLVLKVDLSQPCSNKP